MSRLLYTVSNLVSEVRSLLDELNVDSVDTEQDILPSLNRAQDFAFDILARKYPEPILKYVATTLVANQAEYDIPDGVFEDRIQKIEITIGENQQIVDRISYRDISAYEGPGTTPIPLFYCIIGRKIRFVGTPSGTYAARIWYLRDPEQLVLPQGRILTINTTGINYVNVDEVGSSLTTDSTDLGSYVNWIDGGTGEVRSTLQIGTIVDEKISFRTVPTRATVLNRTIDAAAPAAGIQDDYLSPIQGTCVPYYGRPTCNFLIQFTVAELSRKLGNETQTQEQILDKFEKQVERTWVGRERQMRVQRRNRNWGTIRSWRRWPTQSRT